MNLKIVAFVLAGLVPADTAHYGMHAFRRAFGLSASPRGFEPCGVDRWQHPEMNVSFEPPAGWTLLYSRNMVFIKNEKLEDEFSSLRLAWYPDIPSAPEVETHLRDELERAGAKIEQLKTDRVTVSNWPTERIRARVHWEGHRSVMQVLLVRVRGPVGHGYFGVTFVPADQLGTIGPVLKRSVDSMQLGDNRD